MPDKINYAPPEPAAGVSAAGAGPPDVFDVSKIIGPAPTSPFAKPDPNSLEGRFGGSLAEEAQNALNQGYRAHPALRAFKDAYNKSEQYYQLAHEVATQHHEAARNVAAGNILSTLGNLKTTDPDYETQIVSTLRGNLEGVDHPAVQDVLSTMHAARQKQLEAGAHGGADEFVAGSPGARAFTRAYQSSGGDVNHARAAGEATEKDHKELLGLISQDAVTPADIPPWDGKGKPPVVTLENGQTFSPYTKSHEFNYPELIKVGNMRVGKRADKENRRINADERAAREDYTTLESAVKNMDETDPRYPAMKTALAQASAKYTGMVAARQQPKGATGPDVAAAPVKQKDYRDGL